MGSVNLESSKQSAFVMMSHHAHRIPFVRKQPHFGINFLKFAKRKESLYEMICL